MISKLDFLRRIGADGRVAIRDIAKINTTAEDWMAMLDLVSTVNLDHPEIEAGLAYFVAEGILTEEQKADNLAEYLVLTSRRRIPYHVANLMGDRSQGLRSLSLRAAGLCIRRFYTVVGRMGL